VSIKLACPHAALECRHDKHSIIALHVQSRSGHKFRNATAPSSMPCTRTHTSTGHWPAGVHQQACTFQLDQALEVQAGNSRLAAKLAGTLRGRHDQPSFALLSRKPEAALDMSQTLPRRAGMLTSIGHASKQWRASGRASGSSGVPRTAGMVLCSASFFQADGIRCTLANTASRCAASRAQSVKCHVPCN
jgi:hypothetical protein